MTDEPNDIREHPDPEKMEAIVKKLHREGKLPSLERLTEVISQVRAEYQAKILRARASDLKSEQKD